jgi:hypothetical protein
MVNIPLQILRKTEKKKLTVLSWKQTDWGLWGFGVKLEEVGRSRTDDGQA